MEKDFTVIGYTNIVSGEGYPEGMRNIGLATIVDSTYEVEYGELVSRPLCMISISNPSDKKRAFCVIAAWDTGSTTSCISEELAEKMGLTVAGEKDCVVPSGTERRPTHYVNVVIGNNDIGRLLVTNYTLEKHDCDFLIGMDIISKGKLTVDSTGGKTTVTFEM